MTYQRLAPYVKPELPSPPAAVSYGARVSNWPMYYNNQYLDCTCAAVGHMIQNWTANASAEVAVEPPALLAFYERIAGTNTPPGKNLDLLAVLKYWRRAGLEGHKVLGFASVALRDRVQAQTACWLFGSVYIGVALPDFAAQGDVYTVPWVVPPAARLAAPRRTRTTATASSRSPMTPTTSTSLRGARSSQ